MKPNKGLTPNFEEDIFISYNHIDNASPFTDHQGWVDYMHNGLAITLTQVMGEEPRIWRDIEMHGNELLTETLFVKLSKTAFMVSILSPGYVKSGWCQKELNEFYIRAAQNGGAKLDNRSRIFKVVKRPVGNNDPRVDPLEGSGLPIELRMLLQESLGYEFFEVDKVTGKVRPLEPGFSLDDQRKFQEKLYDLVDDIKDFIERQVDRQKKMVPGATSGRNVYLAETTPDLSEERNVIKRELQINNYRILPDESLPFEEGPFENKVLMHLTQSVLSVHLVGADYAAVPNEGGACTSLNLHHKLAAERVRKQHQLAMARGEGDPNFSRLIWMPEGLKAQEESYQRFIAYLQNDPSVYEGGEVLCGMKLEDLKTSIKATLACRRPEGDRDAPKRIYLYCDKQDLGAVGPLQNYLAGQNYTVTLPFAEAPTFRSRHSETLRECDAAIIFYGSADTADYKIADLLKSEVSRDNRPLLAKGVYVAGPETKNKRTFQMEDILVMKNFGEFSPHPLDPFLRQLEHSAAQTRAKGARG